MSPVDRLCEHPDCMKDAFYTYRTKASTARNVRALLRSAIIVGGDTRRMIR
jgi:predicted AAA+ superfamily ATPase